MIDEHTEKTANAGTSFKNTKQFQIKKLFIDIFIFTKNIWVLSSYQYIPRKPFNSRNPSKLRALCQIKRPLHIIFAHGVKYYFDMIFRLVIYPTFRRFCGFVVQNKFSESTGTFKS